MDTQLTEIQLELAKLLRKILNDDGAYICTMLRFIVNQPDTDKKCGELLKFIQTNPNAGYDDIMLKADEIMGIEDPFSDNE